MEDEELPDFTGKTVAFYLSNAPAWAQSGLLLDSVSFRRMGNRLFVTGRTIDETTVRDSSDWLANVQSGIAWDSVFYYLVFNSQDEWKGHALAYKPPARNRFLSLFFTSVGVGIPIVILIGLIIWVINML